MENEERLLAGICDLKGSQMAQMAFIRAIIQAVPRDTVAPLLQALQEHSESVTTLMLNTAVSEHTRDALSRDLELFQDALKARL